MKKFLILTLAAFLLIGLIACSKSSGDGSSSADVVSTESQNIESSSNANSDESLNENSKIDKLESEIDRLNTLLSFADGEKENLSNQITSLKDEINALKNSTVSDENSYKARIVKLESDIDILKEEIEFYKKQTVKKEEMYVKDSVHLTLYEYVYANPHYILSATYDDGIVVDVIKLNYIWTVRASPNETKVILNDFQGEYTASVYMYDVEKRETKELLMPDLPKERTVANMEWLDDRYFLFVVQLDHGSVVRGGDVYVYDTETDKYKAIIKSEDYWNFQTENFDVYSKEFIVFNSWLDDGTRNFTEKKYHILTFDEIYDLINNNKVLDLSKKDSILD